MTNVKTPIKGYRNLTDYELSLINKLKDCEASVLSLLHEISAHIDNQLASADYDEGTRICRANADHWITSSVIDIQKAFMCANRAVAQPECLLYLREQNKVD